MRKIDEINSENTIHTLISNYRAPINVCMAARKVLLSILFGLAGRKGLTKRTKDVTT